MIGSAQLLNHLTGMGHYFSTSNPFLIGRTLRMNPTSSGNGEVKKEIVDDREKHPVSVIVDEHSAKLSRNIFGDFGGVRAFNVIIA